MSFLDAIAAGGCLAGCRGLLSAEGAGVLCFRKKDAMNKVSCRKHKRNDTPLNKCGTVGVVLCIYNGESEDKGSSTEFTSER